MKYLINFFDFTASVLGLYYIIKGLWLGGFFNYLLAQQATIDYPQACFVILVGALILKGINSRIK